MGLWRKNLSGRVTSWSFWWGLKDGHCKLLSSDLYHKKYGGNKYEFQRILRNVYRNQRDELPWWWRWVMLFLYIFTNRRELELFRATKIEDSSSLRIYVNDVMPSSSVHLFMENKYRKEKRKVRGEENERVLKNIKYRGREGGGLYCIVHQRYGREDRDCRRKKLHRERKKERKKEIGSGTEKMQKWERAFFARFCFNRRRENTVGCPNEERGDEAIYIGLLG